MEATGRLAPRLGWRATAAGPRALRGPTRADASSSGQATGEPSTPPWLGQNRWVDCAPPGKLIEREEYGLQGDSPLNRAVNLALHSPLFGAMKVIAKGIMKSTAEKRGVPWRRRCKDLEASEVYEIFPEIEDVSIEYPSYYTMQFHGYEEGNLSWTAAFEIESATEVIYLRNWNNEDITPEVAMARMKNNIVGAILEYTKSAPVRLIEDVLDVGCSVGMSTRWLAEAFPSASCTGLDLSPYFLSVAELCERKTTDQRPGRRIRYVHSNAEATGLPSKSYDLVNMQFVVHECPAATTVDIVREARRLLRPGGMLAVTDLDPRSRVMQNTPPLLYTLRKSMEPWYDEYLSMDFEGMMESEGFENVQYVPVTHRHRSVMGIKR
ncbi:unnamed protein product [Ostreobium quekettii]|uniref:Methyltransferase type 11 domain-containing protein n=1 Tax=Ostreobium quekettii TaxID=121088 RepID=A0A8S1J0V9_9CHLO|nr:unnamed protein product [Ostreobium quekettii]